MSRNSSTPSCAFFVAGDAVSTFKTTELTARADTAVAKEALRSAQINLRDAWVRALGDCTVLEITSDAFRAFVLNQPALVERIGAVIAERRAGIARARATVANVPPPESVSSLVARVKRFFHL